MTDRNQRDSSEKLEKISRPLRVLNVLEHIAQSSQPVSVSRLAQRLNIPKATLSRLLAELVEQHYLGTLPGERGYVPGPRSVQLGLAILGNNGFKRACRTVLRTLVQALGETCNLTAMEGDRVIHIERVETHEPLRLHIEPHTRLPLHCTAGGKLFLAHLSVSERSTLLDRLSLPRMTPRTFTERSALEGELARLACQGIGVDNEEFVRGMVGVAVPVRAADGHVVAAIVCHAATARASLNDLMRHLPQLREAAERLRGLLQCP